MNTSGSLREASATEAAMMNMINKFGEDIEAKRKHHLSESFTRFHFTSKRKRMSTIMEKCTDNEFGYDKRIHMKGAAEIVLESCTHYMTQDGERLPLKDVMKVNIKESITRFAS